MAFELEHRATKSKRAQNEIKSTFERTRSLANVTKRNQTEICVKSILMRALVLSTRALYATRARSSSASSAARAIFSTPNSRGERKREKNRKSTFGTRANTPTRERVNATLSFDFYYQRTFLTVFVRTRPIFYMRV